jgi:hypothetical protein
MHFIANIIRNVVSQVLDGNIFGKNISDVVLNIVQIQKDMYAIKIILK